MADSANAHRPVALAQIGCGYWGPNLLRNFSSLAGCSVKYVVDPSEDRRRFVERIFPATIAVASLDRALADEEIDGVVVATPARSHFELARRALEAGKHVFVEKPLATTTDEIDRLEAAAARRRRVVMAGHTFIYNAAVRYVEKLIRAGDLGQIRYIYSQRLNLGRVRSDIDALWNFAPHDVSIIQYWLGNPDPVSVHRQGMSYVQDGIDDVVFMTVVYPHKVIANIHVSWLDPQKVRRMIVVGSKKMVVYDDLAEDKIAIYDKGVDRKAALGEHMDFDQPAPLHFNYRTGDILIPRVDVREPLLVEAEHFVDCIRTGRDSLTGIPHARKVVDILQRATPCAAAQAYGPLVAT